MFTAEHGVGTLDVRALMVQELNPEEIPDENVHEVETEEYSAKIAFAQPQYKEMKFSLEFDLMYMHCITNHENGKWAITLFATMYELQDVEDASKVIEAWRLRHKEFARRRFNLLENEIPEPIAKVTVVNQQQTNFLVHIPFSNIIAIHPSPYEHQYQLVMNGPDFLIPDYEVEGLLAAWKRWKSAVWA